MNTLLLQGARKVDETNPITIDDWDTGKKTPLFLLGDTLPETNIAPKNDGFQ